MNRREKQLGKIDWYQLVDRQERLLFPSLTDLSCMKIAQLTGLPWNIHYLIRSTKGPVYLSGVEIAELEQILHRGGLPTMRAFHQRVVHHIRTLLHFVEKLKRLDLTSLTDRELYKVLKEFSELQQRAHSTLIPVPIAGQVLEKMITEALPPASKATHREQLYALIFPEKANAHVAEQEAFLKLIVLITKDKKNADHYIAKHCKKFGWIGTRWFHLNRAWTPLDVQRRIEAFRKSGQNPQRVLKQFEQARRIQIRSGHTLQRALGISRTSQLGKVLALSRSFAYLRTWRTDSIYYAAFQAKSLLDEAAQRVNISENDLLFLTFPEFLHAVRRHKSAVSAAEIQQRKSLSVSIVENGRHEVYSGREAERVWRRIVPKEKVEHQHASGITAYSGKMRGRVCVVTTPQDLAHVRTGDILVAVMTFPHFIAAMEKAAAFVTDEGGILCHAAIISREMKKTCIIGTKNATKVFKNGDRVEVDATKGIVKKL